MENASKALLIAAAVLIVIIIITIGIKVYTSSSETGKVAMQTGDTISQKTQDATGVAITEITGKSLKIDPFDYGTKTKSTVAPGDDISITKDGVTEVFRIVSNTNGTIVAMPHYNITITTDHPVQSPSAGIIEFSTRTYWSTYEQGNEISGWNSGAVNDAVDIDMSNAANNIQKYINAYKITLEDMGAEGITVRAAKYSELNVMINPGQTSYFWIGSAYSNNNNAVWVFDSEHGYIYYDGCRTRSGVRPVIEIH